MQQCSQNLCKPYLSGQTLSDHSITLHGTIFPLPVVYWLISGVCHVHANKHGKQHCREWPVTKYTTAFPWKPENDLNWLHFLVVTPQHQVLYHMFVLLLTSLNLIKRQTDTWEILQRAAAGVFSDINGWVKKVKDGVVQYPWQPKLGLIDWLHICIECRCLQCLLI